MGGSFQWMMGLLCAMLLAGCGSSSSGTATPITEQQFDAPFAIISLGRGEVSPFEPDLTAQLTFVGPNTNDITAEQIEAAGEFSFDEFNAAYELVALTFPTLSIHSNEFALEVIEALRLAQTSPGGIGFDSGIETPVSREFNQLTPGEKLLIFTNIDYGLATFGTVIQARDVSNTMFENSYQSLEDGRGDAFRHSYWNWLMSQCCTVTWAEAFGNAHELGRGQTLDFYKLRMDLNNNQVGRNVFAANEDATREEAQQVLLMHDLEYINWELDTINYDFSRLVYVNPPQSMTLYDDGPAFDDVYEITAGRGAGSSWGTTPKGGTKTITIERASNGEHPLTIKCLVDGTMYGCGFQFSFLGATILSDGMQGTTTQIVIEESEEYSETLTFPTMDVEKEL